MSLSHAHRFNASVGSAIVAGMWRFNRSLNSCVDQILELEGSRMQRELAEIILAKHQNNASRLKLVRKYFYGEQVFNDSNPDKVVFRWRYRNIYVDDTSTQRSEDVEDSSSHDEQPDTHPKKQFTKSVAGGDIITDPLDCIFGEGEGSREIDHPDNSGAMSRRRLRAQKRAHRHHRARQHADSNADD